MRILFVYQYFGTPKGSWSTRVYELTKRWVSAGHEVTVITAPYEKSDIQSETFISRQEVDGIKLLVINSGDSNRLSKIARVKRALLFSVVSSIYVLRLKADVIIASSGPITVGIPGLIGKFVKRIPLVFEVRDLWPDGGIEMGLIRGKLLIAMSHWFEKLIYRNSKLIVTASPGQERHIKKRFPELNFLCVPNASDIELFSESNANEDVPAEFQILPLFLHIGSIGFIHNCMYIMEAAKSLKQMGYGDKLNIVFIGDGSERVDLELFAKNNHLNNVHFLGLMPKNNLPIWLKKATATLFTTLNNPIQDTCSPNKIFDSFAAGIPIIQTSQGWIKDLLIENNCGLNVDPIDFRDMASAVVYLLENRDKLTILKENANKVAKTQFDRDDLAKVYLRYLETVNDKKNS